MTGYVASTVPDVLAKGVEDCPAIGAPGRAWLTYGGLRTLARRTIEELNRFGVGRTDRVAIVLPNGPEMAAGFVAIASGAATAPLNPSYKRAEYDFCLRDLNARVLVVQRGLESPARAAANARGIPIVELVPDETGPAGAFRLVVPEQPQVRRVALEWPAHAQDVALVLHTSGTTSRPKIVPLRQINITASAASICETLALTPQDVCLNIMPLFHVHGLIAAILSSLAAGASVFCAPGFNAHRFLAWFDEAQPTWYTAVPTMHQAILRRAAPIGSGKSNRLRLIRSSSSALPPQVMEELECRFGVPVIESYGMTEASHQVTSNLLPPQARYPGAVGVAAGPEIGIMDEAGRLLPPQHLGEVVIRGCNVTSGYENNPEANAKVFTRGWFRTGDQGYLDTKGCLRLTGRLKELINRGGEKISPIEVDTMLMDHPAVAECLTFALPHPLLGEEVAAVIVLHEGASVREPELRRFAGQRLAAFKVPRKIVFLSEIPKGATGKLQRIGLAEKLGLTA